MGETALTACQCECRYAIWTCTFRWHGHAALTVAHCLWRTFGRQGRGYSHEDGIEAFVATAADLALLLPNLA